MNEHTTSADDYCITPASVRTPKSVVCVALSLRQAARTPSSSFPNWRGPRQTSLSISNPKQKGRKKERSMAPNEAQPRSDAGVASAPVQVRPLATLARKPSFVEKSMPIKKAPHLQPVALAPERWSAAMAPLAFLGTIERVEVNHTRVRDGVTYYVLDVYLYHVASRLPTNLNNLRRAQSVCTSPVAREDAQPDYQVERRFSEFCELRQHVYDSVSKNPHFNCRHCGVFVEYVRFNGRQPRSFVKLTSGINKRKMILSEFMNEFLRMAQNKELQNRKCLAEDQAPRLLEEFVRDPERDSDSLTRLSWL